MNILVGYATKHGSTRGIAEAIAGGLSAEGHDVTTLDVEKIGTLDPYGAVVFGSGIFMGRWLPSARSFIEHHADELASTPTWLFSSGPLGDQPPTVPDEVEHVTKQICAREHRMFAGSLDRDNLGFGERIVARVVNAPTGDFRDWDAIRSWASGIGHALAEQEADAGVT